MNRPTRMLLATLALAPLAGFGATPDEIVSAGGASTTRSALYSNCKKKMWKEDLTADERAQCLRVLDARAKEVVSAGGLTTLKADLEDDCLRMNMAREEKTSCMKVQAALLPPLDPARREEFGESYNPEKYLECRLKHGAAVVDCDLYRLRRKPHPEYWPNPTLPRPVIPDGDKKVYRPGMNSEEYFKALCEAEAGEFIYKTVEDVEAVYQIRPRTEPSRFEGQDRYVLEAPMFLEGHGERSEWVIHGLDATQYPIFEKPDLARDRREQSPPYLRFSDFAAKPGHAGKVYFVRLPPNPVSELRSRYGYYWYGIKREHDRELGVAGGEMVVIDLTTNEVLAVKRGFGLAVAKRWGKGYSPTGLSWNAGGVCPASGKPPYPFLADPNADRTFLNKVLKSNKAIDKGEPK